MTGAVKPKEKFLTHLSDEDIKLIYETLRPNELGFLLPSGELPPAVKSRYELVHAAVKMAESMLC